MDERCRCSTSTTTSPRAGHAVYIDSEWALTSISQRQYWPGVDLERFGDGQVEGVLSVDVSDWERPRARLGKAAIECTAEEIRAEVWAQLKDHLDDGSTRRANVVPRSSTRRSSSRTRRRPPTSSRCSSTPPARGRDRPDAVTAIPNLFLASDFVRTHTDLATMEGANEAARRAVNGILDATGSSARAVRGVDAARARDLRPARALDRMRWKLFTGRPSRRCGSPSDGGLEPTGPLAAGLVRMGPLVRRLFG